MAVQARALDFRVYGLRFGGGRAEEYALQSRCMQAPVYAEPSHVLLNLGWPHAD